MEIQTNLQPVPILGASGELYYIDFVTPGAVPRRINGDDVHGEVQTAWARLSTRGTLFEIQDC